jgi:hypothetical protein
MESDNYKDTLQYKICACKDCTNNGTKLMKINYIYKNGYFCDNCAIDLSFHGLGYEVSEKEDDNNGLK